MRKSLSLLLLLGMEASGATPEVMGISPADRAALEQQQKAGLLQAQQQRETLQHRTEIPVIAPVNPSEDVGSCHRINEIELRGSSVLPASTQRKLMALEENPCMTLLAIQQRVRAVSQAYVSRGYVTSQAWLPEQNIASGHLLIAVSEGRIESITREGTTPLAVLMAFPHRVGQVLNLRDLEQGLEQINRLPSQAVTIDIQPGSQPGYSRVVLVPAASQPPVSLSLGADNSGLKSTGTGQFNVALSVDNPLHLADQWRFAATRDNAFRHGLRSRSLAGNVTLPYGYWLFSYQVNWSDFYHDLPFPGIRWRYDGSTLTQRTAVSRALYRDSKQKLALEVALTQSRTENRIAEQRLANSSTRITSLSFAPHYSRTLGQGYITLNPAYSQGLKGMGAAQDDHTDPHAPRRQFRKSSLNLSYFIPLTSTLSYLTTVYAQTSPHNLYASERLAVGGQYSVRGFKEQYLSGNRGAYWRNELDGYITSLPVVGDLSLIGALDSGWITQQAGQVDGGTVTGSALGLALSGRWFSHALMLGKPLIYPNALRPDPWVAYWQTSLTL